MSLHWFQIVAVAVVIVVAVVVAVVAVAVVVVVVLVVVVVWCGGGGGVHCGMCISWYWVVILDFHGIRWWYWMASDGIR